jgi:hypothetical protein
VERERERERRPRHRDGVPDMTGKIAPRFNRDAHEGSQRGKAAGRSFVDRRPFRKASPDRWTHDMFNPNEKPPSPPGHLVSLRDIREQEQNPPAEELSMEAPRPRTDTEQATDETASNADAASTVGDASTDVHPPSSVDRELRVDALDSPTTP